MENDNYSQLELFLQSNEYTKQTQERKSFLRRIWHYERAILIIIAIVITGIISYSLGVEKGKSCSISKSNRQFDTALRPGQISSSILLEKQISANERIKKEIKPNDNSNKNAQQKQRDMNKLPTPEKQNYLIQLASYKTTAPAQKELESLRQKGFSPLVLKKGDFIVLCVSNIPNKEKARALLSELKKHYSDCYIRRL